MLSMKDVAERLGVSQRTVTRMLERGELPSVKVGRSVRIRPEALQAYLARQTVNTGQVGEIDANTWITEWNDGAVGNAERAKGEAAATVAELGQELRRLRGLRDSWRYDHDTRMAFAAEFNNDEAAVDAAIAKVEDARATAELARLDADRKYAEVRMAALQALKVEIEPRHRAAKLEYDAVRPAWGIVTSGIESARRELVRNRQKMKSAGVMV